ncbi:radical SAM protein [Brachyspira intermedia]|uniref:radical SAM protein n=1 Tax=Brachyspira intermedia TaxID=84377 RepID=UPI0030046BEB
MINYNDQINNITMDNILFHGHGNIDALVIDWIILYGCNYNCSYCFGHSKIDNNFTSLEKVKHAVNEIFKINKKSYQFNLLGGEVTYYPYFMDMVKYIYSFDKDTSILLVTNGSKNIEYFENLLSVVGNNKFDCILSAHLEYSNLEHIKSLIKLFNKYNQKLSINIMMHPNMKDMVEHYFNELVKFRESNEFYISLVELREPPDFSNIDSRYDDDFFKWIDNARNIIKNYCRDNEHMGYFTINNNGIKKDVNITHSLALRNNLKKFSNFYCSGGINLIRINIDGTYYPGICEVFDKVGNIYYENINIYKLSQYKICTSKQCGCITNDILNKYKDKNYADNDVKKYLELNYKLVIDYLENNNNILFEKVNLINHRLNNIINKIAWWIPIKKWRDNFRSKFARPDQTRPDQTRPDQTRPDQTRPDLINVYSDYICFYHNLKYKKLQAWLQYEITA